MRRDSVVSIPNVAAIDASDKATIPVKEISEAESVKPNQSADNISITTPSTLNRSNNSTLSSPKLSQKILSTVKTDHQPESCELQDISRKQEKQNIPIDTNTVDGNIDDDTEHPQNSLSRKKLCKEKLNHGSDTTDRKSDEDGCYNPTFIKSESTVAVDIENVDVEITDARTGENRQPMKDKKEMDSSHVQNVL